jgi:hypothetical protein
VSVTAAVACALGGEHEGGKKESEGGGERRREGGREGGREGKTHRCTVKVEGYSLADTRSR